MTTFEATLSGTPLATLPEFASPPTAPLALFKAWLTRAEEHQVREPRAFVLATADQFGLVSSRTLLLKGVMPRGLAFGSSAASRKGRDIAVNPRATATFYWREIVQQVNVAGTIEFLPEQEADALFAEPSRYAQAVARVSQQSCLLGDEERLRAEVTTMVNRGDPITRPDHWIGYLLAPTEMEFWSGGRDRMHRRLRYRRDELGWEVERLQP